jgi:Ca2+-binding EF-hand superfamily protein
MFDSFDLDGNGRIDANELGRALAHYQYAEFSDHFVFLH